MRSVFVRGLLALLFCVVLTACAREVPGLAAARASLPAAGPGLLWQGEGGAIELGARARFTLWFRPVGEERTAPPDPIARYAEIQGLRMTPAADGEWLQFDDGVLYRREYFVQWLRPGARVLPPLEIALADRELHTEPIDFDVAAGLPPDADPAAEFEQDWIADPPPAPLWPWYVAAMTLALLFGLFVWGRRRWLRRPLRAAMLPAPLPRDVALGRLRELEQCVARGEIDGERLVVECALVLRSWLQHGLGFAALERTTEEFLTELRHGGELPAELQQRLVAFLGDCDLVKFAGQHAHVGLCRSLLARARDFVEATGTWPESPPGGGASHHSARA